MTDEVSERELWNFDSEIICLQEGWGILGERPGKRSGRTGYMSVIGPIIIWIIYGMIEKITLTLEMVDYGMWR